jgi:hypothetical protein
LRNRAYTSIAFVPAAAAALVAALTVFRDVRRRTRA